MNVELFGFGNLGIMLSSAVNSPVGRVALDSDPMTLSRSVADRTYQLQSVLSFGYGSLRATFAEIEQQQSVGFSKNGDVLLDSMAAVAVAGLGGGTGTSGISAFCKEAYRRKRFSLCIVTVPDPVFNQDSAKLARAALNEIKKYANVVVCVSFADCASVADGQLYDEVTALVKNAVVDLTECALEKIAELDEYVFDENGRLELVDYISSVLPPFASVDEGTYQYYEVKPVYNELPAQSEYAEELILAAFGQFGRNALVKIPDDLRTVRYADAPIERTGLVGVWQKIRKKFAKPDPTVYLKSVNDWEEAVPNGGLLIALCDPKNEECSAYCAALTRAQECLMTTVSIVTGVTSAAGALQSRLLRGDTVVLLNKDVCLWLPTEPSAEELTDAAADIASAFRSFAKSLYFDGARSHFFDCLTQRKKNLRISKATVGKDEGLIACVNLAAEPLLGNSDPTDLFILIRGKVVTDFDEILKIGDGFDNAVAEFAIESEYSSRRDTLEVLILEFTMEEEL